MLYVLDIVGTFVFAVSGGLKAAKHQLDFLGFIVLGISTGVGGGLVRDVVLGDVPPAVFREELYLAVCILGGGLAFFSAQRIAPRWREMLIADGIGLGVFAAIGAAKAAAFGLGPIGIVGMAGLTATGGGVIRDVLVREVPAVIGRDFYATAALAGGLCYVLLHPLELSDAILLPVTALVTISLRFFAVKKNLNLPRPDAVIES
ncbi:MAG: trimeric intracellular cation channel family protein [Rhodothermales bacterium]|nr:trimeric intracellular cation channel family protein [Rhodothermales bacterium]